mgnify:CR=1 FL=1
MPKVANIDIDVDGLNKRFEAWFNDKKGFYIKDLPDAIRNARVKTVEKVTASGTFTGTDGNWKHCDTLDELKQQLREAVDAYHENNKSTTKVILYQLSLSQKVSHDHVADADNWWNKWKLKMWAKGSALTHGDSQGGYGFELRWKVRFKVTRNGEEYFDIYIDEETGQERPGMHKSPPSGYGEMPWTAERENFFRSADQQITALAHKLALFMSADPETIAKGIDAGGQKLLGQ